MIDILSKDGAGRSCREYGVSVDVLRELAKVKSSVVADGLIPTLHRMFFTWRSKVTTSRYVHQDIIKHPNVSKETSRTNSGQIQEQDPIQLLGAAVPHLNYISLAAKNAMKVVGSKFLARSSNQRRTNKRAALAADGICRMISWSFWQRTRV